MKILVAEDEQRAREGLCDLIRTISPEYEIVGAASNGRAALDMIREKKPDVVFTDIKMPYMSGLELMAAAREEHFPTRFVLVSAYQEFEYAREAMQLGCDDYILKPPMKDELKKALENEEHLIKYGSHSASRGGSLEDEYPQAHPLVKSTLRIIESGYKGNLSQQTIAGQLDVSPEYLSYLFSRDVGKPFAKYVKEYRIHRAQLLLGSGAASARDVYTQVGFTDRKYFNKVFHEVTGQSAADFARGQG